MGYFTSNIQIKTQKKEAFQAASSPSEKASKLDFLRLLTNIFCTPPIKDPFEWCAILYLLFSQDFFQRIQTNMIETFIIESLKSVLSNRLAVLENKDVSLDRNVCRHTRLFSHKN